MSLHSLLITTFCWVIYVDWRECFWESVRLCSLNFFVLGGTFWFRVPKCNNCSSGGVGTGPFGYITNVPLYCARCKKWLRKLGRRSMSMLPHDGLLSVSMYPRLGSSPCPAPQHRDSNCEKIPRDVASSSS